MANWNGSDGLKNQKKRSFIYKSCPQSKMPSMPSLSGDMTRESISSPRKKMRSSYSFYDKARSDQEAVEQLCCDLPLNAFEDDDGDFENEFEKQLLKATEVAEQQIAKSNNPNNSQPKEQPIQTVEEDYFGDLSFDQDGDFNGLQEPSQATEASHLKNVSTCFPHNSTDVSLNEAPKVETFANERTAVLISSESESTNQLLQNKLETTQQNIKKLEEEKYIKDGKLKTLQDSLEHVQAEEAKNREKIRTIEEDRKKEIKENERAYEKKIEQLTSKLKFQEQEILQAREQRPPRHVHLSNENAADTCSIKKVAKLSENSLIPAGQSFFEKKSPDLHLSPNIKKASKYHRTDNSEEITNLQVVPSELSRISESGDSRDLKKKSLKNKHTSFDGADVMQKLIKIQNPAINNVCSTFEVSSHNQSLLPLLQAKLKPKFFQCESNIEEQTSDKIPNDCSEFRGNKMAVESFQELLNNDKFLTQNNSDLELIANFKVSNCLDSRQRLQSALGFFPILEHHISIYHELRSDTDDDSLASAGSPSYPGEPHEPREPLSTDRAVALSEAVDAAVQSLRCLDILVLHGNQEVCEVLMRSAELPSTKEEPKATTNKSNSLTDKLTIDSLTNPVQVKTDLLNLVLKLVIPLPNEPPIVSFVSLHVLASLAQCSPLQYKTRFLAFICSTVLPQCVSKSCRLSTLSLVVQILTVTASDSAHIKYLCSQSDECLLLKVFQGCLEDSDDISARKKKLQMEVFTLIENILSKNNEALDSDCRCSLKMMKYLVLLLHKEMVLIQYPPESLMVNQKSSGSFLLLRHGVFLLANMVTNSSQLLSDLCMDVEQQFNNLIIGTARCYGAIKDMPECEVLALQDLLDSGRIEDVEVIQEFEQEGPEDMETS